MLGGDAVSATAVLPLFLVVRASDFDDGEVSSGFRDYFW
jgi:hypothetical protein